VECSEGSGKIGEPERALKQRGPGPDPQDVLSLPHTSAADPDAPRVLVVDDQPEMCRLLCRLLGRAGFEVHVADKPDAVLPALDLEPEVVLLDLQLEDSSGIELIPQIQQRCRDAEIVIMTGYGSIDSAVACMRAGVFDYLEKPFPDQLRVVQTLERALERRRLYRRNRELEGELDRRAAFDQIIYRSAAMRRVVQTIQDLAPNESNVLIEAESGTGKELVARAIHETSARRTREFVAVDCGALPESIAEGELFGYERGAFTGAVRASPGWFRSADGGTLFLDEIGELAPLLQSKLLRAIQEGEVKPLGADRPVNVDVRILAATNRDLAKEVREGRFRSDLFYRLRVVPIHLPALRERMEDIPVLAAHFLKRVCAGSRASGFEPAAIDELAGREWPGNVRELQNTIEAAAALAPGPRLTPADFCTLQSTAEPRQVERPDRIELSLEAYERACLDAALREAGGDVRRAARLIGIGRSTFYRKLGGEK